MSSRRRRERARLQLNLLCVFENISRRHYKIILNDENKFSRRLNDVNMTFRNQF